MRRPPHLLLAAGLLTLLLPLSAAGAAPQPPSQGAAATVEMGSNYYAPREVRVDVGGTVTWRAAGGQHDVRADDGSFFLWADRKSSSGETRSQTFTEEGIVRYYCTLHGGPGGFGMSGIVYVGDAELETPPELHVPSDEHPTLRAALRDARQGSTIHLAPGVHRAGQRITQPGVTIVGTGDDPGDVVLRAATAAGLRVEADNTRLAKLTIASGSRSGVLAEGVDRLRLDDVHVVTDDVGVRFDGGRGLTIHGGAVEGHRRAGVLVTGCDPCDARIEGLRAEDNLVGIDVVDAAGVFLRGNLLRGNGGGIRAADTPADPAAGPRTLVVTGNRFVDNAAGASGPSMDPEVPVASGTAIWLAGVRQAEVLGNEVEGEHLYGVALTALAGPTVDVAVRDNLVGGATEADLAWDGLGAQVCFAGNRTADGDEPTSQPPMAQTLYDCANPATVGVPDPRPLLGIGGHALGGDDEQAPPPDADEVAGLAPFADLAGRRAGLGR